MKNTRLGVMVVLLTLLSGCAKKHPHDPLEPLNRGIYQFNKGFDTIITNPVVKVYEFILPPPFQAMIGNIFFNLGEIPTFANDILQAQPGKALKTAARFGINTTVGMAGMFDIATEIGLDPHSEDVGQTLGVWGYKNSSYLVLPILGPSTIRDTIGMGAYYYMSVPRYLEPRTRNPLLITNFVQKRSDLSKAQDILDAAAVDEYVVVRDGYLQRRAYQIGNGTREDDDLMAEEPPE